MPPTVPDEFSLIYQNLLLPATLVQAFRLPFTSLSHIFYVSDEYTAFTFKVVYFIAKATPSDSGIFLVVSP